MEERINLVLLSANVDQLFYKPVERLYCKRPMLCLASSKILTPSPPLVRGEDTLAGGRGGWGGQPDTALYYSYVSTLCINLLCRVEEGSDLGQLSCQPLDQLLC